jgi:hypothetical protein
MFRCAAVSGSPLSSHEGDRPDLYRPPGAPNLPSIREDAPHKAGMKRTRGLLDVTIS